MGYARSRGNYWTANYPIGSGKHTTVKDHHGRPVHYKSERAAKKAADAAEVNYNNGLVHEPAATTATGLLFHEYVEKWMKRQDLAENTIYNYQSCLECHLLPAFGRMPLAAIDEDAIAQWETNERKKGNMRSSIRKWRAILNTIMGDAVREELRSTNPATVQRGRGRRTSKRRSEKTAKVITTALGTLLVAERMALLSGRDDEFVAGVLKRYTGMRSGELWGLETKHVGREQVRVEWQLASVGGKLLRIPPKFESRRTLDWPEWLWRLVADHVSRTNPKPCDCHGQTYVFRGLPRRRSNTSPKGVTVASVAKAAGVSYQTVSNALRGTGRISDERRQQIIAVAADLGYEAPAEGEHISHWARESFRTWIYTPAVSGKYPPHEADEEWRPVRLAIPVDQSLNLTGVTLRSGVLATPTRSRIKHNASWLPIAEGMTPHGNRHAHRTDLEEHGIPKALIDERLGHEDSSVQAIYTHVTPVMRARLNAALTDIWYEALDARLAMCPTSHVKVLNGLLQARAQELATPPVDLAA